MRDASVPAADLSVVIAWVNPLELLLPGLEALERQSREAAEIIVVSRHPEAENEQLRNRFPKITVLAAPEKTPITALRSQGIRQARGAVVVVTGDHCIPDCEWVAAAEKWISRGYGIAGGPVEKVGASRWRDWAGFLTDYAPLVRPADPLRMNPIPGNNAAYSRAVAREVAATLDSGRWESFCFGGLQARGVRVKFDRDMLVYHQRPFGFRYFLGQRYHFCRWYAAMRLPALGTASRWRSAAGSLARPPLLLLRGIHSVMERRQHFKRYMLLAPWIFTYLVAGAIGEMTGYVRGSGDSGGRLE